jgi:uncharacterized protein with PQ loop repeat
MVNSFGLHHATRKSRTNHRTIKRFFNKIIYVIAVLVPLAHVPQLFKIWLSKDASGISLISWTSFTIFSLFWLVYGIVHKEKPLIIMYVFLIIMQTIIVIGGFLYG